MAGREETQTHTNSYIHPSLYAMNEIANKTKGKNDDDFTYNYLSMIAAIIIEVLICCTRGVKKVISLHTTDIFEACTQYENFS